MATFPNANKTPVFTTLAYATNNHEDVPTADEATLMKTIKDGFYMIETYDEFNRIALQAHYEDRTDAIVDFLNYVADNSMDVDVVYGVELV